MANDPSDQKQDIKTTTNQLHKKLSEGQDNQSEELITHPSYEELMLKLDEAEKKRDEHWEQILRMQADKENLSRRMERDIGNAHKFALEKFASELVPIIDSLELCISKTPQEMSPVTIAVIEGVELTLKMFYTAIAKFGIKQVNPVSEPFDPEYQQAISLQVDPEAKPGTVISVLQKGYTLNNRLLRPALVVVAKGEE